MLLRLSQFVMVTVAARGLVELLVFVCPLKVLYCISRLSCSSGCSSSTRSAVVALSSRRGTSFTRNVTTYAPSWPTVRSADETPGPRACVCVCVDLERARASVCA